MSAHQGQYFPETSQLSLYHIQIAF